jgi:hypothetical protein
LGGLGQISSLWFPLFTMSVGGRHVFCVVDGDS